MGRPGAAAEEDAGEVTFSSSKLDRRLVKATAKLGFVNPTLVQRRCIPLALSGKDLLVRARTGSGKTAAYGLPLLHKILTKKQLEPGCPAAIRAVVLVPTRELCEQVRKQLSDLVAFCGDDVRLLALSGESVAAQAARLRDKPDVVISTPARLVSHLESGNVDLKESIETLVVDEADLVLSFGYKDDMRAIAARLPNICQGFLMSATLNPELQELKRVILHSPVVLKLEEGSEHGSSGHLSQYFLPIAEPGDKFLLLFAFVKLGLLQGKGLFFVNSVESAFKLKLFLEQFGIRSAVLNAELPLNSRMHILEEFNHGIFDFLIATDASMDATQGDADSESDSDGAHDEEQEDAEEEEHDDEEEDEHDDDDSDEDDGSGSEEEEEQTLSAMKEKEKKTSSSQPTSLPKKQTQPKKKREAHTADEEYGVARGVDFKGVQFVVNVDFPPSASSYSHRIGRTARGGASGTALSLVIARDDAQTQVLHEVQQSQPPLQSGEGQEPQAQPVLMPFDIREIEQFRYRVSDAAKRVTTVMVRDARLAELKAEMVNSDKLRDYFAEHPDELKVLRHDKTALRPAQRLDHLKHVPDYLMPAGMTVGPTPSGRGNKRRRRAGAKWQAGEGQNQARRKDNDPLQSFESGTSAVPRIMHVEEVKRHLSSSGRQQWKMRHKKGKFASGQAAKGKRRRGVQFNRAKPPPI